MDRTFKIGDTVNTINGNFDEGEGTKITGIAGNGLWIIKDIDEETNKPFELIYKTENLTLKKETKLI